MSGAHRQDRWDRGKPGRAPPPDLRTTRDSRTRNHQKGDRQESTTKVQGPQLKPNSFRPRNPPRQL